MPARRALPGQDGPAANDAQASPLAVLAGAEALFVELGYENTSMDQVARRAHVPIRALHSWFEDKPALFRAAVESVNESRLAALEAIRVRAATLPDRLDALARRLVAVLTEPRFIAFERILAAEARQFPALAETYARSGPDRAAAVVCRALRNEPPFAGMDEAEIALSGRIFVALTILPFVRRAMFSDRPLDDADAGFIRKSIDVFLSGAGALRA